MSSEERDEAESQLLGLYSKIGEGCYALSRYDCAQALAIFKSLPASQGTTPFVSSRVARALYESRNLSEVCYLLLSYSRFQAYKEFVNLRRIDPDRVEDMELFSTVLFHLNKEVDLAFLAHEMVDLDWLAPQTWCVVGNSYASMHEHDQAIACFQRAIQLDPHFAYAYSLQGLEHTENEEFDKARQCFMNALRANRRLYNAWLCLIRPVVDL
jgi:anaphase-promoting complex subunit 3